MNKSFTQRYAEWVVNNPRKTILLTLLVFFTMASGMSRFAITADYKVFFGEKNPQLEAFEALEAVFNSNDNVLLVIEDQKGELYTKENMQAIHELTQKAWTTPYSKRVDSLTNFQHTTALPAEDEDEDPQIVAEPLVDDLLMDRLNQQDLDKAKRIADQEKLLRDFIVSPTKPITALNITFEVPDERPRESVGTETWFLACVFGLLLGIAALIFAVLGLSKGHSNANVFLLVIGFALAAPCAYLISDMQQQKIDQVLATPPPAAAQLTDDQCAAGLTKQRFTEMFAQNISDYASTGEKQPISPPLLGCLNQTPLWLPEALRAAKADNKLPSTLHDFDLSTATSKANDIYVADNCATIEPSILDRNMATPLIVNCYRDITKAFEEKYPHLQTHLTGIVLMNNAFPEVSTSEFNVLFPLCYLLIIVTMALLLRNWQGVFISFFILAMSFLSGLGAAMWSGIVMTSVTFLSPLIIMTLAVANCIHLLVTTLNNMRNGADKKDAFIESLRVNMQPVFLTSSTTAIGFLSMNFSDSPPFQDLGNIVAYGVAAAWLYSITILPAAFVLFNPKVKPGKTTATKGMEKFADFVVNNTNKVLVFSVVMIGLTISFIRYNHIDDTFVNYFDESVDFRSASDFTADNLTGMMMLWYNIDSGEPGGISNPAYLHDLDKLTKFFRSDAHVAARFPAHLRELSKVMDYFPADQRIVTHVMSYSDVIKRINKNMNEDKAEFDRIPDTRADAAEALTMYENSLPTGLSIDNLVSHNKRSTRLQVSIKVVSTREVLGLEQRAKEWMQKNTPNLHLNTQAKPVAVMAKGSVDDTLYQGIQVPEATGPTVMFSHIGHRNIYSMLYGTLAALLLISALLLFALRSVKVGLLSLIPNLVPVMMGFGLWGLLDGEVGLALSIVAGMTLGIVVDDTVHILSKYLRARRELGLSPADSARMVYTSVGTALWVTSFVLVAGFLVNAMSSFTPNSDMGLMTAVTIMLALIADFLLLPALLMKLERKTNV